MNHCIAALLALAASIAAFPSCATPGGRVGDPCIGDDEYYESFGGFTLGQEVVIRQAWDCSTRLCIVDRFQGRATCPLGQRDPRPCAGPDDTSCLGGAVCTQAGDHIPPCDAEGACTGGLICDTDTWQCECASGGGCPEGYACDLAEHVCKRFVCHTPGSCQQHGQADELNEGKACCVPGTDTPVGTSVCAQCEDSPADTSVYCSCRCDGPNPCGCPDDFECRTLRYPIDQDPNPKYCFRKRADPVCIAVHGSEGPSCQGE